MTNTIGLSEVRVRPNLQDQRGAWALPWTGATLLAFDMHSTSDNDKIFVANPISLGQTQLPNSQGPNGDMLYNCNDLSGAQLNRMPCNTYGGGAMAFLSAAPRSNHEGGVYISLMDGSVRFIRDDVDQITMSYLVSINDGQVIQATKVLGNP
jgi:hypothetical protein